MVLNRRQCLKAGAFGVATVLTSGSLPALMPARTLRIALLHLGRPLQVTWCITGSLLRRLSPGPQD
jgi:hypothetical protein